MYIFCAYIYIVAYPKKKKSFLENPSVLSYTLRLSGAVYTEMTEFAVTHSLLSMKLLSETTKNYPKFT